MPQLREGAAMLARLGVDAKLVVIGALLFRTLTAMLVADAMLDNRVDALMERTSPRRFGDL